MNQPVDSFQILSNSLVEIDSFRKSQETISTILTKMDE